MKTLPHILYLATTALPRIPGTDAVFQDIDALRQQTGGAMLNLYPFRFATRFYPPFMLGLHARARISRLAGDADLLHVFAPGLWDIPALSHIKKPIIHTVTASLHDRTRLFSHRAATKADTIIVSHPADVDWLARQGITAMHIPPAIDLPTLPVPDNRPERFTILVGSAPWSREQFRTKGIDALLAALKTLPGVNLIFLWRGFLRDELDRRIAQHGLSDRIEVIDEHADVYKLLARSQAAIVLAKHAGVIKPYPHSLLEALAAGRPVIVSDCIRMAKEIQRNGCGVVVDSLADESVTRALTDIHTHYDTLARASTAFDTTPFSRPGFVKQYESLYKQIMPSRYPNRT